MIKKFNLILIFVSVSILSWAQTGTIESVLTEIESNNLTLKTLRDLNSAQKYANKEDITLSNPEIEFNYIWGANSPLNSKGIAVSQEFDLVIEYIYDSDMNECESFIFSELQKLLIE
jgi:hypothetical protein